MEEELEKEYLLETPIKIYCPIMKAKLTVSCELLDQMSEFTRYILYLIGEGYALYDIDEILELGEFIIREEIDYVTKIGLVENTTEGYKLSEVGESYFNILCVLEEINKNEIIADINCFNGMIMKPSETVYEEKDCEEDIFRLSVKIIKELYQNRNPANSREYILEKFDIMLNSNMSKEQIEKLYVTLIYEKGRSYKLMYINKARSIMRTQEEKSDNDMILVHEVIPFKFNIEILHLEKYRNILSTLKNLNLFEEGLISDKSIQLLKLKQEEELINFEQHKFYFDTLTKQLTNKIENSYNDRRISTIQSYEDYNEFSLGEGQIDELLQENDWYYKYGIQTEIMTGENLQYYEKINSLDFI